MILSIANHKSLEWLNGLSSTHLADEVASVVGQQAVHCEGSSEVGLVGKGTQAG